MDHDAFAKTILLWVLTLIGVGLGCGDRSPRIPTAPSHTPAQVITPPAEQGAIPAVTGISPSTGAVGGGTRVEISGTGFGVRATVTFGNRGAAVTGWAPGGDTIVAVTPPGAVGTVDVTVTNENGQSGEIKDAFTYGTAAPLTLAALAVPLGSTAGGTYLSLGGSGFQPGIKVTIGGSEARVLYLASTGVTLTTRPHAAGTVDVVSTMPDGQVARLDGGYTYVAPRFGDFNGVWEGHAGDEGEMAFRFVVRNDSLVEASCAGWPVPLASLPSASGGEFAVANDGRATMTGALVGVDYAEGTLNVARCTYETVWFATRLPEL